MPAKITNQMQSVPQTRETELIDTSTSPMRCYPLAVAIFILMSFISGYLGMYNQNPWIIFTGIVLAALVASSVKIATQWEKAIVLRLGKYYNLAGPGLFFIIPIIDSITIWIDQRIMITSFTAEQTLTKDTVPVDVDAVLFWLTWDPEKAALEVADYRSAVAWAAQTALREMIGKTQLADMLIGREILNEELCKIIDQRTEPWGVSVQSVEIRDVIIPTGLQDAMSREAQAERERRARIILGTAETEIALKFAEASKSYVNNPVALQLRAMNILYEGLKENGGLVVVPSSVAESMEINSALCLTALSRQGAVRPDTDETGEKT